MGINIVIKKINNCTRNCLYMYNVMVCVPTILNGHSQYAISFD